MENQAKDAIARLAADFSTLTRCARFPTLARQTMHTALASRKYGPARAGALFMPQVLDRKIGEWRDADSKARQAEKAVARLQGQGQVPTDILVKEAKLLRKVANEKLRLAIAAMKPAA